MTMLRRFRELIQTTSRNTFDCDLRFDSLITNTKMTDVFWGMNRQFVRTLVLLKLMRGLEIDAFVETGTNKGKTCFLIASQTSLPIYSSEVDRDYFRSARRLLFPFGRRIHLFNEDSVTFLGRLLKAKTFRKPFFYLDAHWPEKLPLRDEVCAIIRNCPNFVIVIDDFLVPNDRGFGFDTYNDVSLSLTLVLDILLNSSVKTSVWFPSYPSDIETGNRRGWTLITAAGNQQRIKEIIPNDFLSLHLET